MNLADPRTLLFEVGRRLAEAGLVRESEGNLSIRLGGGTCLMTSTGSKLGNLQSQDLVEVALESDTLSPAASSEARLHLELYRGIPEIGAVVHAHPPRLLQLDARGKLPVWRRLEDRGKMVSSIVAVPHHPEGSRALADSTAAALRYAKTCVLREHGAVSVGPTLMTAFVRMLDLERAATLTGAPM